MNQSVKLAIFKPDGLGDFVLALSGIRLLVERFGPENTAIVVTRTVEPLAKSECPGCRIIAIPYTPSGLRRNLLSLWRARQALRSFEPGVVVSMRHQRDRFYQLLFSAMRWQRCYVIENLLRKWLPPSYFWLENRSFQRTGTNVIDFPIDAPEGLCLELEAHRRMVSSVIGEDVSVDAIKPTLSACVTSEPILLVSPLGSIPEKTYPFPKLAEAIAQIPRIHELLVVLCGSRRQATALESLRRQLNQVGISHAEIRCSDTVVEFVRFVGTAQAVITVDTAAAHIATSLDKPTAVIFGGVYYGLYGPWSRSSRQQWVLPPLETEQRALHPSAGNEVGCIAPSEIASALRRALAVSSGPAAGSL